MTGKFALCTMIDGTVRKVPIAKVTVDTPYLKGDYEVMCMINPVFDLIIGNAHDSRAPSDPDPLWTAEVCSVLTRAHKLKQEYDNMLKPVSYASRKLLPREKVYSTIEKECLALVWAVRKFHVYLYGKDFILQTDHAPLACLNQSRFVNDRIMRWALSLQPYRMRIVAIKGSDNVGADYLSRSHT